MELAVGTRIFYGGDMANIAAFGVVTKAYADKWGRFVDLNLDDGRALRRISAAMFSEEYLGHGGTRFVTEQAYNKWRAEKLAAFGNAAKGKHANHNTKI